MKKKNYLYCAIFLSVTAKCTTLTCNDFLTCSIAEEIKPVAGVEEKPTFYVKLNNKLEEIIVKESVETEEAVLEQPVETEEASLEQPVETEEASLEQPVETEEVSLEQPVETEEVSLEQPVEIEETEQETEEIQENIKLSYTDYDTPPDNSFKSYMDYRTITDTTSMQYELQSQADTDWCGMRKVDNKYCVAVGSYYSTSVGQAVDVIMQNGNTIHCIVADLKQDIHTDSTNRQNPNGSVVEFLVDTDILHKRIQRTGDISYFDTVWGVNFFSGEIKVIRVYD